MKTWIAVCTIFCSLIVLSTANAQNCESKMGFILSEPSYTGENSLWASLRILSESGDDVLPTGPDIHRAGLCVINLTALPFPNEATLQSAPAMLVKKGAKLFVLFHKNYNQDLTAWPYNEDVCIHQIDALSKNADRYLGAPANKVSFDYQDKVYALNVATNLFPIRYEVKKVAGNYVVKKDSSEYCVFAATSN